MREKILFINGPNLNLLGVRNPTLYGNKTLLEIVKEITLIAEKHQLSVTSYQDNSEGNIINFLNEEYLSHTKAKADCVNLLTSLQISKDSTIEGIIINPGALTHTSIALRDALELFAQDNVPIIEVHLSNIYARENFRQKSFVSSISVGVVSGLGVLGYHAALNKIIEMKEYV